MKTQNKMRIFAIVIVFISIAACNNKQAGDDKPTVTVTILPQEYFVKQVAGELFAINVMIPPGSSPATYEPTPSQLARLSETDLYLKMGYTGFEMAWMDKMESANEKMQVINLSEGINLIMEGNMQDHDHQGDGHHHGGVDPHVWLSPKNAKIIAENIYKALSAGYPEYDQEMKANLQVFLGKLDQLDTQITEILSKVSSRAFFTYHPSLSYFSRDYGLEQYPLELGGKTPSSAHLRNLVDIGREKHIKVVFLQMQFDQKNAEVLADEIGAEIVQINPLDPEWYEQMLYIADKLKENLQ